MSYVNGKYGLHLVVYLLIGKVRFPWSFAVWKGKGHASESKLAVGMIKSLCRQLQGRFYLKILTDSGFDHQYFLPSMDRIWVLHTGLLLHLQQLFWAFAAFVQVREAPPEFRTPEFLPCPRSRLFLLSR